MEILDWLKGAVDKIGGLFPGVNMALVLGLIVILLVIRFADARAQGACPACGATSRIIKGACQKCGEKRIPKKRLGNGAYAIIVAGCGFLLAFIAVRPFDVRNWIGSGINHAGAASILYQLAKTVIPAKLKIGGKEIILNPDKSWITRPK